MIGYYIHTLLINGGVFFLGGSNLSVNRQPAPAIDVEVDQLSQGLTRYLEHLGLPSTGVLVSPEERFRVISNLPSITAYLPEAIRKESMYISKFVAACSAGLFDAALNMIWNETVVNLREKVKRFDINYFLDSVISDPKRRATIRTEDDLNKLEEWELVKGCKDTGIITDIGYKHLDYIREMRNHASAAHPNHNDITGLQVVTWLETCIREVLAKEPTGPVIQVRQLLHNLRNQTLTTTDVPHISASIQRLPVDLVDSTLRAVFGMYTSPEQSIQVKTNVSLVVEALWNCSSKLSKNETGIKYATFSVNADLTRKTLAEEFLTLVNGLSYLPTDLKVVSMDQGLDALYRAHFGWNNFYNEPAPAKLLASYVPDTGDIPSGIIEKYVKTIVLCKLGNTYGVSTDAEVYYDEMIAKFTEILTNQFVLLLWDRDVRMKLGNRSCESRFRQIAGFLAPRVLNTKLKEVLNWINSPQGTILSGADLDDAHKVTRFFEVVDSIKI